MNNSQLSFQDTLQVQQRRMSTFGPSSSHKHHRSLSPICRRSSTTAFESVSRSRDSSPPPNRRFSNPTNQTTYASKSASCSRSRSPSDSQYIGGGVTVVTRRFSQPISSNSTYAGSYAGNEDEACDERRSLASKEKESYSSLTYLPEVRAYLKFMEDDIPMPHRSKSFNGRNSSRRSSYNQRKRSKSRTRTPTPTPMDYEDDCFQKQFLYEQNEAKSYGRFLTPQRSLEPSTNGNRSQSVDFTDMNAAARYLKQEHQQQQQQQKAHVNEPLTRRRSGSIIRTSFI